MWASSVAVGLEHRSAKLECLISASFELPASRSHDCPALSLLLCCCRVSVVRCGTRILRFSQANSGAPSVAQAVQQSKRRRGLTGVMIVVRFEPEAVGD